MIKKNIIKSILITLGILCSQITVFAGEIPYADTKQIESVKTYISDNVARIVGTPRGMLISAVELSITDLGSGKVEFYGHVLCHEPMEKIKLNLYLDKWLSSNEDWGQLEKFEFTWLAEDYPGEELTIASAAVEVPGLERGIDYRVRGIAGAWDLDSNLYEVFRADTASILVE